MCIAVFKQRTVLVELISKDNGDSKISVYDMAEVTLKDLIDLYNNTKYIVNISFN